MNSLNDKHPDEPAGLPSEVERFRLQIGGHKHAKYGEEHGILKHKNGDVLKPLFDGDRRATTELSFYTNIYENKIKNLIFNELKHFLPRYHGIWIAKAFGKTMRYLCLEDLCSSFLFPSILDTKIGSVAYDKHASEEKKLYIKKKYACGEQLGIRVTGMKTFNFKTKQYESEPKSYWTNCTADNFLHGLKKYLTVDNHINYLLIAAILHELEKLLVLFQQQKEYEFIASSLLFVYEGNLDVWEKHENLHGDGSVCRTCLLRSDICTAVQKSSPVLVKMIDFAHTYPSNQKDTNYLHGLKNLADYFKALQRFLVDDSETDNRILLESFIEKRIIDDEEKH